MKALRCCLDLYMNNLPGPCYAVGTKETIRHAETHPTFTHLLASQSHAGKVESCLFTGRSEPGPSSHHSQAKTSQAGSVDDNAHITTACAATLLSCDRLDMDWT